MYIWDKDYTLKNFSCDKGRLILFVRNSFQNCYKKFYNTKGSYFTGHTKSLYISKQDLTVSLFRKGIWVQDASY